MLAECLPPAPGEMGNTVAPVPDENGVPPSPPASMLRMGFYDPMARVIRADTHVGRFLRCAGVIVAVTLVLFVVLAMSWMFIQLNRDSSTFGAM